jgi:hypothetical protein
MNIYNQKKKNKVKPKPNIRILIKRAKSMFGLFSFYKEIIIKWFKQKLTRNELNKLIIKKDLIWGSMYINFKNIVIILRKCKL